MVERSISNTVGRVGFKTTTFHLPDDYRSKYWKAFKITTFNVLIKKINKKKSSMHRYCFMLWMMYKCIYKVLKKKFYFWKRFCLFRVNICLILSDSVTIFVIYLILLRLTYVWKGGTRFLYLNFHAFFGNAKLSALHQFRDMSRILYLVFLIFF